MPFPVKINSWETGSVGKVLALQASEPEFEYSTLVKSQICTAHLLSWQMVRWQTETGRSLEACGPAKLAYTLKFQASERPYPKQKGCPLTSLYTYMNRPQNIQTQQVHPKALCTNDVDPFLATDISSQSLVSQLYEHSEAGVVGRAL